MERQKGYKCSPETRAKMSKGRLLVFEKNLATYGYKVFPETKAKMSASRLKYLAEHPEAWAKTRVQMRASKLKYYTEHPEARAKTEETKTKMREGWARRKARLALEQPPQPTTL